MQRLTSHPIFHDSVRMPTDPEVTQDAETSRPAVVIDRLTNQKDWYDRKSGHSRWWYLSIKVTQIGLAALVPVLSGAAAPAALVGSLGAGIVALEGVQQLFQFHRNWVQYRATANLLGHEQYLHSVLAGPYAHAKDPDGMLAERIERALQGEATQWVAQQRQADPEAE
jgi:hypothetical protein